MKAKASKLASSGAEKAQGFRDRNTRSVFHTLRSMLKKVVDANELAVCL